MIKGHKLNDESLDFSLNLGNLDKQLPDILASGTSETFINAKVKTIVTKYLPKDQYNLIEVKILEKDYWLLNILGLKNIIDKENSIIEFYENGELDEITNLEIVSDEIQKFDLFRIKEYETPIFITENFKSLFEKEKITGITFLSSKNMTEFY